MIKFLAPVVVGLALTLSACGNTYNVDEVPDISPENLYDVAKSNMAAGDYGLARRYLEAIDSRYPFGDLTEQVQLDLIHVYYKSREPELAHAQIARFIRLSPTHPNIDYVYYMKGLTEMQQRGDVLQDYLEIDRAQKDPTFFYAAFNTFKDLIRTYPNSIYAADARQRMIYIKEQLARREMAIAQYYRDRGAYVSSIRHSQVILQSYRNTTQVKPAIELMAICFERLKLEEPTKNVKSVIQQSFGPNFKFQALPNSSAPLDAKVQQFDASGKPVSNESQSLWNDVTSFFGFGDDEILPPPSAAPQDANMPALDSNMPEVEENTITPPKSNEQA